MRATAVLSEWFWPRDPRTSAEIEADVRAELQVHVAMLEEQLMHDGAPADEARRQAAAQFGDLDQYARECQRIDLGDRLWMRRLTNLVLLGLAATTAVLAWQLLESRRTIAQMQAEDQQGLVQQILDLRDHMQTAFAFGPNLLAADPDAALAAVRAAWPEILQPDVKTGLLKTFAFSKPLQPEVHPHVLQVLHLGMTDADVEVRDYAQAYVSEYAGDEIANDPAEYSQWYADHRNATVPELLAMKHRTGK
ncbi:MAG: hypothetical protein KDA44_13365 [Planctomycetales bacterium]|nr:hypothetical protein [Planctomycetales bacterium]